jgi:hypothetical protein
MDSKETNLVKDFICYFFDIDKVDNHFNLSWNDSDLKRIHDKLEQMDKTEFKKLRAILLDDLPEDESISRSLLISFKKFLKKNIPEYERITNKYS